MGNSLSPALIPLLFSKSLVTLHEFGIFSPAGFPFRGQNKSSPKSMGWKAPAPPVLRWHRVWKAPALRENGFVMQRISSAVVCPAFDAARHSPFLVFAPAHEAKVVTCGTHLITTRRSFK